MSESNSELARRWFDDVWNRRRDAAVHELFHVEGIGHLEGADVRGPAQFLEARSVLLEAFPDLNVTVEATAAEGADVAVRWSAAGTHQGAALGIPASRRRASFRGVTWLRFKDGRIVEGWDNWNVGGLLQQLAAPPASGAGGVAGEASS